MNHKPIGYRVVRYLAECTEVCSAGITGILRSVIFRTEAAIQDGTSPWTDIELYQKFVWKKTAWINTRRTVMKPHIKPFDINDYAHKRCATSCAKSTGIRTSFTPSGITTSVTSSWSPWWRLSSSSGMSRQASSPSVSSWNSTGLGRMCLCLNDQTSGSQIPTKETLGYKRTKDGVDMVFSDTDFIHPKDMTRAHEDRGLNAVEGLRDALYDMTDPQVPKAVRQEINELIKFTLGYIDGVRMNLERVKFPDDMPREVRGRSDRSRGTITALLQINPGDIEVDNRRSGRSTHRLSSGLPGLSRASATWTGMSSPTWARPSS